MASSPQFSLVLSGGGLKGLAHIGVLRALEERGLRPSLVVGCSMGSLVGAAWAAGMPIADMERLALSVTRKDIFRVAHVDMALRRMLAPAVYRSEPLDHLIRTLVGDITFHDLKTPLVVDTADINSGRQVYWGLPGLRDAQVADAVFASCALPGILPPRRIQGHWCVDGAVVENLPVRLAASVGSGPVMAVDVGGAGTERSGVERKGFAATYTRGLEIVMQTLFEEGVRDWHAPPMILVRPRVERISMFAFNRTPFLVAEGYRALNATLDRLPKGLDELPPGIHPRVDMRVEIDSDRCVGCGVCAARLPAVFGMNHAGRAEVHAAVQRWSAVDRGSLRMCPTRAITAEPLEPEDDPGSPPR